MANEFGELVRKARLDKGWSQRELARRIKKSPTYIHYVERGFNPSSNSEMQAGRDAVELLAKVLDLSPVEALNAAGYASEPLSRPRTIPELIAALERLGIEPPQLYGGLPDDPDGEGFAEIVERIWLDIELVTARLAKKQH